jgi:hypothetical protein
MPSIRSIFADPDLDAPEEGDAEGFDLDKVLESTTAILNDRPPVPDSPMNVPLGGDTVKDVSESQLEQMRTKRLGLTDDLPDTPATDEPVDEPPAGGDEAEVEEPEDEEIPPTPFDSAPPPAASHDPWLDIPAERRAAILALDETLVSDPSKRAAVFGILSGDSDAPAAPTAAPTLPEHIDPDSFEATLWRENQEMKQQIAGVAQFVQERAKSDEAQRASQAATIACQRFGAKYTNLTEQDVIDIAKYAAQTGMSTAFMGTAEAKADPSVGYGQALEAVLWSNEGFRARVLETSGPVTHPGEQEEATTRKRKLRALSGAASPVSGPAPTRPPLQTGTDGKLTEDSRQGLVKEAANMIRRTSEGTL